MKLYLIVTLCVFYASIYLVSADDLSDMVTQVCALDPEDQNCQSELTEVLNTAFSDSATALKCLSFIKTAGQLQGDLSPDEVQNLVGSLDDGCLQFLTNPLGNSFDVDADANVDANVDANANVDADANIDLSLTL